MAPGDIYLITMVRRSEVLPHRVKSRSVDHLNNPCLERLVLQAAGADSTPWVLKLKSARPHRA
jgi:hypothetical protein